MAVDTSKLPRRIDPEKLRRRAPFAHYFRYELRRDAFEPVRNGRRLLGYIAAKPVYGKFTLTGHGWIAPRASAAVSRCFLFRSPPGPGVAHVCTSRGCRANA